MLKKNKMKSNGLNIIIDNNQSRIYRLIGKVNIGEVICNDNNQTIAFKAEIKRNDKIEVTNYTFIFFTSKKIVQFVNSSKKSEFDKFEKYFITIVNSFKWR
jgi:hypothetical protein